MCSWKEGWDCVTNLELDLLGGAAGSVDEHGLAESDNALLDTGDGTLEHNEVVVDLSVADEATHGGDGLLGDIELGRGVTSVVTAANTVDLVVDRGTVVVTVLTSTGNGPLDWVGVSVREEVMVKLQNIPCEGCQAPIQATLRRPLWVFLGSFLVPQREVTPEKP